MRRNLCINPHGMLTAMKSDRRLPVKITAYPEKQTALWIYNIELSSMLLLHTWSPCELRSAVGIGSFDSSLHHLDVLAQLLELLHPHLLALADQLLQERMVRTREPLNDRKTGVCRTKLDGRVMFTSISLVMSCTFSLFFSLNASRASLYSLSCNESQIWIRLEPNEFP